MVVPVSDGVQGAYVAACVCTGAILGGAATIFKEITESLGCLLGGFCFSMWLLTLHEGGLVSNSFGKIIFVIAFTLIGFSLYFSRYTRAYALIVSISFSGASASVLGIDCFSRAGLKEFWAYIWALNDDLFPLGADTYPLTKGIRVEIALIILISLVGIISQLKLWRVIQEHREKRAEARAEAQQQREIEEANVGQQIEAQAARDRRQWEATYGDKAPGSLNSSNDSGIGDINEKKGRYSQTTVKTAPVESDDMIELSDLSSPNSPRTDSQPKDEFVEIDLTKPGDEGRTVARVAEDDLTAGSADSISGTQDKVWVVGVDGEARPASSHRISARFSMSTAPDVTPLPFRVPDEQEMADEDDRSSFATFADDDDRSVTLSKRASQGSWGNRLSIGSGHLLKSMSRGSLRSTHSKRKTGEFSPTGLSYEWTGSREHLVAEARADHNAGNMAATVDGLNTDGIEDETKETGSSFAMEITAELNHRASMTGSSQTGASHEQLASPTFRQFLSPRPNSTADTAGTDVLNTVDGGQVSPKFDTRKENLSSTPSATSVPASLTKDRLPSGLSRVASTYRTNEWAKHLSLADIPEPESLRLSQDVPQEQTAVATEAIAPVNLKELQQTAENATPASAFARTPSSASRSPLGSVHISRSNSKLSVTSEGLHIVSPSNAGTALRSSSVKLAGPPSVAVTRGFNRRSVSAGQRASDVYVEPIAEELANISHTEPQSIQTGMVSGQILSASAESSQPGMRSPAPGMVSYSTHQTLLGKREMLLRNKSSIINTTTPDPRASVTQSPTTETRAGHLYPSYESLQGQDLDDLPLSQRKQLIRQSSLLSNGSRPTSHVAMPYTPGQTSETMAEVSGFDSHQPKRRSTAPSQQAREAQLASFRNSVAQDRRVAQPPVVNNVLPRNSGRDFLPSQLHYSTLNAQNVERTLDQSRSTLLNQKGQETQRKELERLQKQHNDRVFEESMRSSSVLMDAHRDAMRRLQGSVR